VRKPMQSDELKMKAASEATTAQASPAPADSQGQIDGAGMPPPEPYGLDTIPAACKAFFLVHGEMNAIYARGYNQPAVGIGKWHQKYSTLPAFSQAERIWVVLNDTEDNLSFVTSIAADKAIRRRCLISTKGVQLVTKSKMLWERSFSSGISPEEYRRHFEEVWHFQALPTPSEIYKLRRLGRPKPKEDVPDLVPPWLPPWGQW
jgi:hypothetical protein